MPKQAYNLTDVQRSALEAFGYALDALTEAGVLLFCDDDGLWAVNGHVIEDVHPLGSYVDSVLVDEELNYESAISLDNYVIHIAGEVGIERK